MRRISCWSSTRSTHVSARCTVFSQLILDERSGLLVFEVTGRNTEKLFASEPGGHRWQRVPPTERRGRRHTSTVTVAVLPLDDSGLSTIDEREIEWQATRGSGAGGQHRNKTSSAIQMKHLPTGISVRIETERSQTQNRELALRLLSARVAERERQAKADGRAQMRRQQVGSGERGDKIRTIRTQDGVVVDHRTGKRMKFNRYQQGYIDDLI